MGHSFVRWIGRRALRWFYREVRLVGAERIPLDGPVLLVGNHPNDLPDVLLGFLSTPRPVRYVATAAAAASIPVRWIYAALQVIPVTRVKDARKLRGLGVDTAAGNVMAFGRVTDALASGEMVGLFPEGGVFDGPGIGPIRSGVAKLALESCISGRITGIKVIPIGVQYESPFEPASDVVAVVGEAISLDHWLTSAPERPHAAFTVELRRLLESVSRTARTGAAAIDRDRLLAAMGGAIALGGQPPIVAAATLHSAWPFLLLDQNVTRAADALCDFVERAGGKPVSARDCQAVIRASSGEPAARWATLLLKGPVAMLGLMLHAPALRGIWWLSKRKSEALSDRAARAIVPGFYLIFAWYAVLGLVVAASLRATSGSWRIALPMALLFILAMPRLGDFSVAWYHEWLAFRLARRVQRWPEVDHAVIRHSMRTLQSAWASHIHGPDVSILV